MKKNHQELLKGHTHHYISEDHNFNKVFTHLFTQQIFAEWLLCDRNWSNRDSQDLRELTF